VSAILFRSVLRLYTGLFLSVLGGVLVVFLVGDFSDRLGAYIDRPVTDVALLYWNKLLVAVHQLAPAAMLLAGGATASILRKRGEWTAMQALGLSRLVIVLPIVLVTASTAVMLVAYDELVVTRAGPRVDRMMVERFGRWGDFRFFYLPHRWFRLEHHLVYVRGESREGLVHDVSLYEVDSQFRLLRRLDVEEIRHQEGDRWVLTGAVERSFPSSESSLVRRHEQLELSLPGSSSDTFVEALGRPEFMRTTELLKQLTARARVGISTQRVLFALHNRFTYPATGVGGTLLALALALRRSRKGHLTQALLEGLVVTLTLFGMLLTTKALVLGDHLSAGAASWTPVVVLIGLSVGLLWSAERPSRR
jgi:lipopolysaccharide export system permease protein